MAKSATKTLARTNTSTLNRTHLITLSIHTVFILYRLLYRHSSVKKYLLLSFPSLLIELYLEKLGRPKHNPDGTLKSAGEDMAAKGVTEYAWDIVYATWIVLGVVGVAGEWAWWLAVIVPGYAAFLAYTMYADMKRGIIPGMPAPTQQQQPGEEVQSKRAKKMEKRGGQQKTQYR